MGEMAIDQGRQRKRRYGPRTATGCGTCRIRRIKCDETLPNCRRCTTTGRKCDGYRSDFTISGHILQKSINLGQQISVHIPGNAEEKRGFDFFLRNTAAELSGYHDSSFWENLILAASAQKPSLRHAVVALGSLHEDFSRKRLDPSNSSGEDQKTQFALLQYAKAMAALRRSLSCGKEEPLMALMSCILFVCFDSLRGCFESALVHLRSGLRILRDMRRSTTLNPIVEDTVAPLFLRLSIQSIIYVETKSPHDKKLFARELVGVAVKDIVIPERFESQEDARNSLDQVADGLFRALYMWDGGLPLVLQPTESLALFNKYTSHLCLWNLAFENLLSSGNKELTSREVQGAALLKIHHSTLNIMVGISYGTSDMRALFDGVNMEGFVERLDHSRIVVNLSTPLIATIEQDAKNGKPPLTFGSSLGLIGPLYFVCINCPIQSIRTKAMELLLRCQRREGMWDSGLIAQMIQQYWDLEARHKEAQEMVVEVDEFGFQVPNRPFTDGGSVHFAYFGRSTLNATDVFSFPLPEGASPESITPPASHSHL